MDAKRTLPVCVLALLAAVILVGCNPAGTTGAQSSPSATSTTRTTATPTSIPTIIVHGEWETYTDALFGFRLDFPTGIRVTALYQYNGEDDLLWNYDGRNGPPPPDLAASTEIGGQIFAATGTGKPSHTLRPDGPPYPCTAGTPITIGSGITAYEEDSLDAPPPPPGAGHAEGGFDVNLATGGVYFHILLYGTAPKESFRARYGAIWQHILNSFVPGPAVSNGHPCG